MNKKAIIFIILLFLVIAGCAVKKNKDPIKISLTTWPGYAYAFIAQEKGFFEKNQVDVELISIIETTKNFRMYINDESDGFLDPLAYAIQAESEGIPTKVVFVADYSDTGDVIIGRANIRTLQDLKGKTLSFEGINSFSHIFILTTIEKAGLTENDVSFKNVAAKDVLTELEAGNIDAGHTWEPTTSEALEKGYKIIAKAGDYPGSIIDILGFHAKIVKERPDDIKAIIKSLLEARNFIETNRDEALEIMSKGTSIPIKELKSGIKGVRQPALQENILAMTQKNANWSLFSSGERIIDFYISKGQISYEPDLNRIVEPRFLLELTEERS